jgi:hypothetical protein
VCHSTYNTGKKNKNIKILSEIMKRKLLLFVGVSVSFSAATYLIFLLFDLAEGTPRESDGSVIRFAVQVGTIFFGIYGFLH